jgi:SAM-dependent methyltransferase
LGFLRDQPDDVQLARFYEEYYYPEHGGAGVFENSTRWKSEQHLDALSRRCHMAGKVVLDYGCGVGNFMEVARERGWTIDGVEFDDTGRATARGKGFDVRKSIGEFGLESIDFIYMNDVIEHLRDPVADLTAMRERLRHGGSVFVCTMNMKGLAPRVRRGKWGVVTNPTHLWFYDEASLRATLQRSGFDHLEVQRWPVTFDHHGHVRRLAQRALQATGLDGSLRMLAARP